MRIYVDGNSNEVCCVANGKVDRAKIDGTNTNNVAEYRAVLFGLHKHPEATEVYSDNQLVVRQLSGDYAIKNSRLRDLADRVEVRLKVLKHEVKFTWVPKEDNPAGKVLG